VKVETRGGLKVIEKVGDLFQVSMGAPSFKNVEIGFLADGEMTDYLLKVNGSEVEVNGVSIGNPHCVIFTDSLNEELVKKLGPIIENHNLFKNKINVEWAQIESKQKVNVAVWERGAGYTLACGTGACAVFAVARKKGLVENRAIISLPGGDLEVEFHGESLFLKGEARKIFEGKINI
ncbi:MAG: diaminopimelate epimerase, partial [Actinobacteria bacterium]